MWDIIADTLFDVIKLLPFLFLRSEEHTFELQSQR